METVLISKIKKYSGKNISVNGWVYNSRRSGKIGFLSLRDGFGIMQCIIEKKTVGDKIFDLLEEIIRDLKNYELELRIEELESKFSKDLNENTFNEIRELKKLQNLN